MKHVSFKDWEQTRIQKESDSVAEDKLMMGGKTNAELVAEITSLKEKKGVAAKNKSSYDHQIYELDIKLLELELDKNRLNSKKKELTEAAEIAKSKKVKDERQQSQE